MATVKTVLVKGRCNSRGAYPLAVQVLHKRKKKVFYTGYSITPCEFDSFSGRVLFNGAYTMETVRRMNRTCRKICKILDKAIGILEREGNEYTTCDIARVYETLTGKVGFYSYFRERIRVLFDTGHEGTAKAYEATLHSMQKHLCKTDFPFAHLSSRLVIKYRDTLLEAGVEFVAILREREADLAFRPLPASPTISVGNCCARSPSSVRRRSRASGSSSTRRIFTIGPPRERFAVWWRSGSFPRNIIER
jgi:hypothetical protein